MSDPLLDAISRLIVAVDNQATELALVRAEFDLMRAQQQANNKAITRVDLWVQREERRRSVLPTVPPPRRDPRREEDLEDAADAGGRHVD